MGQTLIVETAAGLFVELQQENKDQLLAQIVVNLTTLRHGCLKCFDTKIVKLSVSFGVSQPPFAQHIIGQSKLLLQ